MERNRPVTIFSVITLLLVCVAGVLASFTIVPDHPIRTSLLILGVIVAGIATLIVIQYLMFAPLLTILAKLLGKKPKNAEHAAPGDGSTRA